MNLINIFIILNLIISLTLEKYQILDIKYKRYISKIKYSYSHYID